MTEFGYFGRIFIFLGIVLVIVGVLLTFAGRIPWLGRLPGDIIVHKKNVTFYFPLATSILLSIILSLILWLISRK
ncbi:MAG: DUF2905 domain-containing protein [Nitrospirota bacterium]